jgi:3-hydroxyacyl-CoA dehydrogenase/enoyl-CoA hydratase/3-hydroxybutyryl-CoA epimerase
MLLEKLKSLQAKYGERFAPRNGWSNPALAKTS